MSKLGYEYAFPVPWDAPGNVYHTGMTVRTWLAGQALAGVSVDELIVKKHQSQQEVLAQVAVQIADRVLAELERTEGGES